MHKSKSESKYKWTKICEENYDVVIMLNCVCFLKTLKFHSKLIFEENKEKDIRRMINIIF